MDNRYKRGIETRQKIIDAAKKVFYERGYYASTIKMIKEEAGVSLSAIPYYFTKKEQMVAVIYNEFLAEIYAFLDRQGLGDIDSYLKHFHASKIYYYIILKNPNNSRFYYEVSVSQSNFQLLNPLMNTIYMNYAKDFNIPLTEQELRLIRMSDAGARRELLYNYYNQQLDLTVDELINYVTSIVGTLIGIDKSVSEHYGKLSSEYVASIDYEHIRFL